MSITYENLVNNCRPKHRLLFGLIAVFCLIIYFLDFYFLRCGQAVGISHIMLSILYFEV